MSEDRRATYEQNQRASETGLVPRSIRLDAETNKLLAEATERYENQNEAIKAGLKKILNTP